MANDYPTPKRRWSRWRLAVVVMVCLTVVFGVDAYLRQRRAQWLIAEIRSGGGTVGMPEPVTGQLLGSVWKGLDRDVYVRLNEDFWREGSTIWSDDHVGEWLRDHSYLDGLRIESLQLDTSSLTAADVVEMIEAHPIKMLTVRKLRGADEVAAALGDEARVEVVDFDGSDLSDEGLRRLPLERLTHAGLFGTAVTSEGLSELQRCSELTFLGISGVEPDRMVAALIEAKAPLTTLWLSGPQVTDEQLQRLRELPITVLRLSDTSVSDEFVEELRKRLPGASIKSGSTTDPPE